MSANKHIYGYDYLESLNLSETDQAVFFIYRSTDPSGSITVKALTRPDWSFDTEDTKCQVTNRRVLDTMADSLQEIDNSIAKWKDNYAYIDKLIFINPSIPLSRINSLADYGKEVIVITEYESILREYQSKKAPKWSNHLKIVLDKEGMSIGDTVINSVLKQLRVHWLADKRLDPFFERLQKGHMKLHTSQLFAFRGSYFFPLSFDLDQKKRKDKESVYGTLVYSDMSSHVVNGCILPAITMLKEGEVSIGFLPFEAACGYNVTELIRNANEHAAQEDGSVVDIVVFYNHNSREVQLTIEAITDIDLLEYFRKYSPYGNKHRCFISKPFNPISLFS